MPRGLLERAEEFLITAVSGRGPGQRSWNSLTGQKAKQGSVIRISEDESSLLPVFARMAFYVFK